MSADLFLQAFSGGWNAAPMDHGEASSMKSARLQSRAAMYADTCDADAYGWPSEADRAKVWLSAHDGTHKRGALAPTGSGIGSGKPTTPAPTIPAGSGTGSGKPTTPAPTTPAPTIPGLLATPVPREYASDAPLVGRSTTDCDDCGVPMEIKGNEYICDMCGFTRGGADHIIGQGKVSASIVSVISGEGKIQQFNASGPVEKSRADALETHLMLKQADYASRNGGRLAFPPAVISAVAARYADIQQQHELRGYGPFIHRGEVRRRFISALLRDECGIQRYPLKSEIIAEFMQLNSTGFSDGETIMQKLVTMGLTTICDPCPPIGFAERYLDFLEIRTPERVRFVVDIVETSKLIHLCMSSHVPSKVVGAIRLLVVALGRDDITPEKIEQATEKTKVNTYMKFYTAVVERLSMFIHVFEENGIDYPIITLPKKMGKRATTAK